MNNSIFEKIATKENLIWAWNKIKSYYQFEADFIPDLQEYESFDINVKNEIDKISTELLNGSYVASPITFMALPKGMDENNKPQYRQNFYIPIRDQLVWIAIINILGPRLDIKMPFWSFGSRLYFPVWYEQVNDTQKLKCGKYRPSALNIYRNWAQSWPLFRKAVKITVKRLCTSKFFQLEKDDKKTIDENDEFPEEYKIKYFKKEYWQSTNSEVYWASLDFSKFYPKIKHNKIVKNINDYAFLNDHMIEENGKNEVMQLINEMLKFNINCIPNDLSSGDTTGFEDFKRHKGIPTGLLIGGFLANVAMLDIDKIVEKKLQNNRQVAHFRYVDDHIILASSFDQLISWITEYENILENNGFEKIININKTEPKNLKEFLASKDMKASSEVLNACKLDPEYPAPLMTLTLKRMSDMHHKNFILMSDEEKMAFKDEIIHLLLTELPDNEMKTATRVSWGASMLNKVVPNIRFNTNEKYQIARKKAAIIYKIKNELRELKNKQKNIDEIALFNSSQFKENIAKSEIEEYDQILELYLETDKLSIELANVEESVARAEKSLFSQIFGIYIKTIKENHSKPIVWSRAISYCKNTGHDGICVLFDELKKYYEKKYFEKFGYEYILAVMYAKLAEEVLSAICMVKTEEVQSKNRKRIQKFLNNIIKNNNFTEIRNVFLSKQKILFNNCIAIAKNYVEKGKIYFNAQEVNANVCWIVDKLHHVSYSIKDNYENCYSERCRAISISSNYSNIQNLICKQFFPIFEEEKMIRNAESEANNLKCKEANFIELICKINKTDAKIIKSEWFALVMMKKIVQIFDSNYSFKDLTNLWQVAKENKILSPFNIVIKVKKNYEKSFNLKKYECGREDFIIEYINNINYIDERYLPINNTKTSNFYQIKYFIGILFVKLITKIPRFDDASNAKTPNSNIENYIGNILNRYAISSWTKAIIQGCLSNRAYETQFAEDILPSQVYCRDDTLKDPIRFENCTQIIDSINVAIEKLNTYRVSLCDNNSYQLVPVRLEQFNKSQNPFSTEGETSYE